ncbi:tumor necrosis factor ligand superfamily member 15 [Eleutherodactylus coqui]|uniref:tumor necrosis factor ligand superfamily member 15 n=1 Tax=Eleutherodactylus coqui TaxID=57060 RepID=UPI003461DCB9
MGGDLWTWMPLFRALVTSCEHDYRGLSQSSTEAGNSELSKHMETRIDMLREERNYVTSSSGSQDRSIRRLKWAVAFCFLLLCSLVLLTVYLLQGGFPAKIDKGQTDKHLGPFLDADTEPKAHLTAKMPSSESPESLQWESKRGLAILINGMTYSDQSIVIPKEGYYFVYSQLTFRPPNSGCSVDETISQIISRSNFNYPEPETILSGISYCTNDGGMYQPIYLAGLVHLKRGDKLKVKISPFTQVDASVDHKTFFGAFWV